MSLSAAQALTPSAAGAGGAATAPSSMEMMGAMSKDLQAQQAKSQPAPLPSAPMMQMPVTDTQTYRPYRSGGYGV